MRRTGRSALLLGAAAVPPLAWLVGSRIWYGTHAYDLIAPNVLTQPHWSVFVHSISDFGAYVSFFGPALAPLTSVALVLLVEGLVGVIVFSIRRRARPLLLATLSLIVLIGLALSLKRASDVDAGLYLSGPRLLLPLPFAVWFLAFGVSESAMKDEPPGRVRSRDVTAAVIVAAAAVSLLATQLTFSGTATRAVAPDLVSSAGVRVTTPAQLTAQCDAITKVYRATGAQLLATVDLNVVYGCAAEDGLNTLATNLDRRGWVIQTSLHQPVQRILAVVPSCRYVEPAAGHCTSEAAGVVLVRTPPVPPAHSLDRIRGLHVHQGTNPGL
jgi:hypothetical protein